jgi:hypothetical protein
MAYLNTKIITENTTLVHPLNNSTVMQYWHNVIPVDVLEELHESTLLLSSTSHNKVKSRFYSTRNFQHQFLLGWWRKYQLKVHPTAQTEDPAAVLWFANSQKIIKLINKMFEEHFPLMFASYAEVVEKLIPNCPLGVFSMVTINEGSSLPHMDVADKKDGLCWIVPFGRFTGGQLILKELNVLVNLKCGDVIAFQSSQLTHFNLTVSTGRRHSAVFFTHQILFSDVERLKVKKLKK